MGESRTSKFYRDNPDSRKKRQEYQREYNKRPDQKRRRAELNKEGRDRGIYGQREAMGKDVSHTKGGGTTLEDSSRNRARNGMKKGKSPASRRTDTRK